MLYTRRGDNGTSGLFGTKNRLTKDDPIFEALGSVDELNSLLGFCRAKVQAPTLLGVQEYLFVIQAELAGAPKVLTERDIQKLEKEIDKIEVKIKTPKNFVIPGTNEASALLDFARAVARRAERRVLTASKVQKISDVTIIYLNRLSSLLYALARLEAQKSQHKEPAPGYSHL